MNDKQKLKQAKADYDKLLEGFEYKPNKRKVLIYYLTSFIIGLLLVVSLPFMPILVIVHKINKKYGSFAWLMYLNSLQVENQKRYLNGQYFKI